MVTSDLLDFLHLLSMKVVLSSATVKNGAQSVMTSGETLMPWLYADNLASLLQVIDIILTNSSVKL